MQSRDLAVVQVERVANDQQKRFSASVTDCSSRSFSSSFERGCPSWTACSRACSSRTGRGAASAMLNSKWAQQVGERADNLAAIIHDGSVKLSV
jgi:hypothetical protein